MGTPCNEFSNRILVPDELKADQAQSLSVFSLEEEIQGLSVGCSKNFSR